MHNIDGLPSPGSLNKLTDKQVKKLVGDVHDFKEDIMGDGSKVSSYDVYVDTNTGDLYLMAKNSSYPIPTGFNKNSGWTGNC